MIHGDKRVRLGLVEEFCLDGARQIDVEKQGEFNTSVCDGRGELALLARERLHRQSGMKP